MGNRILQLRVINRSLDPAQAEIWIVVEPDHITPTTELRGLLAGPRCLYAATVEVSYPMRPLIRRPEGLTGLAARVVIPEASLWEPECPFTYQGTIELWEDGMRSDQAPVRHGLRRILLGPGGLRINGEALKLHGRALTDCDEKQASALRRAGCNLLLSPPTSRLCNLADLQGFFVLGRLNEPDDAMFTEAHRSPSCLGWLLAGSFGLWDRDAIQTLRGSGGLLIGVQMDAVSATTLPEWVDFVACPAEVAAELGAHGLPLLLLGGGSDASGAFATVV